MTLPGSYLFSILLLVLSMLCWGSWANTFKASGKWRFELYYYDFAVGVLLAGVAAAFTFGTLGLDGFSVTDELGLAGKRQDMYAFLAGAVFNLANMLLVAAISVAGMAVAFPIGIGLALIIGVGLSYLMNPVGNLLLLAGGCVAILGAIVLNSQAWKSYAGRKAELAKEAVAAAQQSSDQPKGKTKAKIRKASSSKGITLALISGVLMGLFYPLVELAKQGENGLGPYTAGLIFALGVFASTFIYNMFFMNLPVQGQAVEMAQYFRGKPKQHLLGLLGGIVWFAGAISNFAAARAEGAAQVGPAVSYAMGQGSTLISALWGLIVWKEFAGAESKVRTQIAIMLLLFVVGLSAVSIAPLLGAGK